MLFINSGADRILALDVTGTVVRDTGPIEGLNPGGGNFGPDGRYYVGLRSKRGIMAFDQSLAAKREYLFPGHAVPFPQGFTFDATGRTFWASGNGPKRTAFEGPPGVGECSRLRAPTFTPGDIGNCRRQRT